MSDTETLPIPKPGIASLDEFTSSTGFNRDGSEGNIQDPHPSFQSQGKVSTVARTVYKLFR